MKSFFDNSLMFVGILVGVAVIVFFSFTGVLLFFVLVCFAWWFKGNFPIRQFGYEVPQSTDDEPWPAVYETNLDLAFAYILASRLRGEDIPVIVENDNLFNSGINWEFGLSVFLRIRVSPHHEDEAHGFVRLLMNDDTNSRTGSPP